MFTSILVWLILLTLALRFFVFDFVLFKKPRHFLKQTGWFFRKLLSCPFCQGFWTGLIVYVVFAPYFITIQAVMLHIAFGFITAYISLVITVWLEPQLYLFEAGKDLELYAP